MKHPRIPTSTYRLQFNRQFTFAQAREIVPYLRCARDQRLLCVALFPGARGKPPRLRHHRSQQAECRDRFARGVRRLDRRSARARHGADRRFRPEPHGHRRAAQSMVDGRSRKRPQFPLRALFRHPMEAAQVRSAGQGLAPDPGRSIRTRPGARRIAGALRGGRLFSSAITITNSRSRPAPIGTSSRSRSKSWRLSRTKIFTRNSRASSPRWNTFRAAPRPIPNASRNATREKEIIKRRLERRCQEAPQVQAAVAQAVAQINGTPGEPRSFDALDLAAERSIVSSRLLARGGGGDQLPAFLRRERSRRDPDGIARGLRCDASVAARADRRGRGHRRAGRSP